MNNEYTGYTHQVSYEKWSKSICAWVPCSFRTVASSVPVYQKLTTNPIYRFVKIESIK